MNQSGSGFNHTEVKCSGSADLCIYVRYLMDHLLLLEKLNIFNTINNVTAETTIESSSLVHQNLNTLEFDKKEE